METSNALPTAVAVPTADIALMGEAERWKQLVDGYVVDSGDMYEAAGEDFRRVKGLWKKLDDERKRIKEPSLEACKRIDAFFARPLAMLDEASRTINRSMIAFSEAEKVRAREQQRRLDEAAAAERKRAAEQAAMLAAEGRDDEADQAIALAEVAIAPATTIEAPKAAGTHTRTAWKAEVADLGELIDFIAANRKARPELLQYVCAEMPVLNKLASALKDQFSVPGVRAVPQHSVVAR